MATTISRRNGSNNNDAPSNTPPAPSPLGSVPGDVLAEDILGFLTDKAVGVFLESALGEKCPAPPSRSELKRRFCARHGSRLEDPASFEIGDTTTTTTRGSSNDDDDDSNNNSNNSNSNTRSCPECYAEQQNLKRCNGCKVFYPRVRDGNGNDDGRCAGLSCQVCHRLAFCGACLSKGDGEGATGHPGTTATGSLRRPENRPSASPPLSNHTGRPAFGAFGRKRPRRYYDTNNTNKHGRVGITCQNYCCPSAFTNTMCGEFVCDDCGDEHQRRQRLSRVPRCSDSKEQHEHERPPRSIDEACGECGKTTCFDPHCLVCADFRLIHISCGFDPEEAYRINIDLLGGRVLFGSRANKRNRGASKHGGDETDDDTDDDTGFSASKILRNNLSDAVVWTAFFVCLSKMWWFSK